MGGLNGQQDAPFADGCLPLSTSAPTGGFEIGSLLLSVRVTETGPVLSGTALHTGVGGLQTGVGCLGFHQQN